MDVKAARAAHLQRQLGIVQAEQARSSDALGRYLGRADLFTLVLELRCRHALSCFLTRAPSPPHSFFFSLSLAPTPIPSTMLSDPDEADALGGGAGSGGGRRRGRPKEEGEEGGDFQRLAQQPAAISGGAMRDYQLEGLNWLVACHAHGISAMLADEMGLGKTLQTISLLAWCRDVHAPPAAASAAASTSASAAASPDLLFLVLAPKSTLANWERECARFCPTLATCVLIGQPEERAALIEQRLRPGMTRAERGWDVLIASYEMASIEAAALKKLPFMYLVVDEAHRLKNEESLLATVVRHYTAAHRLLLTGTPLQNNLHELWALLNFLLPTVFADSGHFDAWFERAAGTTDEDAKARMVAQLHAVLRPFMLRRLKADVAKGLPPKKETLLYVTLTSKQRALYRSLLLRDASTLVDAEEGGAKKSLQNIVMHLRKACNHPYLFPGQEDRMEAVDGPHLWQSCAKTKLLAALLPQLQARGHRVLLFCQMTSMLDVLEDMLGVLGFAFCRIDGNTAYRERDAAITSFNREGSPIFIFLLSTRAGGLGINLATADTVILYDSDWNPQMDLQAQDRAHRIGQTKPVTVFRLVTEGTIEERMLEHGLFKLKLDALVVQQGRLGGGAGVQARVSKEELLGTLARARALARVLCAFPSPHTPHAHTHTVSSLPHFFFCACQLP